MPGPAQSAQPVQRPATGHTGLQQAELLHRPLPRPLRRIGRGGTLAVHVTGAFHVIKHGLPRTNDGGSIVITPASWAHGLRRALRLHRREARPGRAHAGGGDGGGTAAEVAPRRIQVNTLHPGPTSTTFQDEIEMAATGLPRDRAAAVFDDLLPLERRADPDEIAAAFYLAGDESTFVTRTTSP